MKLIVGLGNPGKEYENTRHNVGFIILNNYVNENKWLKEKNYEYLFLNIKGEKVMFLKPMTFMNLSGNAVINAVKYYKINNEDILVIHDDKDLTKLKYRLKYNSSSGGHNGIKSIINSLGNNDFARLKIGIGSDNKMNVADYVLSKMSSEEINYLKEDIFKNIIDSFITYGIEKTMNDFN